MAVLNRARHKITGMYTSWLADDKDTDMSGHWDISIDPNNYEDFQVITITSTTGIPLSATPNKFSISMDADTTIDDIIFTNTEGTLPGSVTAILGGTDSNSFRLSPTSLLQGIDYSSLVYFSDVNTKVVFDADRIYPDTTLSSDLQEFTSYLASWRTAIATASLVSGKWYWEVERTYSNTTSGLVGICSSSQASNNYIGSDAYGWGCSSGSSGGADVLNNSAAVAQDIFGASVWANSVGDVVGVAYDADNGYLYFSLNGVWGNGASIADINAGAGANAISVRSGLHPAVSCYNGQTLRLRYKASELEYTVPTGFSALEEYVLTTMTVTRVGGLAGATLSANIQLKSTEGDYNIPITAVVPDSLKALYENRSAAHILPFESSNPLLDVGASATPLSISLANITRQDSDVPGCLGRLPLTVGSSRVTMFTIAQAIPDLGWNANRSWIFVLENTNASPSISSDSIFRDSGSGVLIGQWDSGIGWRIGNTYISNWPTSWADLDEFVLNDICYLAIRFDNISKKWSVVQKRVGQSKNEQVFFLTDGTPLGSQFFTQYWGYATGSDTSPFDVHFFASTNTYLTDDQIDQDLGILGLS